MLHKRKECYEWRSSVTDHNRLAFEPTQTVSPVAYLLTQTISPSLSGKVLSLTSSKPLNTSSWPQDYNGCELLLALIPSLWCGCIMGKWGLVGSDGNTWPQKEFSAASAFVISWGWIAAQCLGRGVDVCSSHKALSCTNEHSVKRRYLNSTNNKDECVGSDLQDVDMPAQC